jgi:hypothetical protein
MCAVDYGHSRNGMSDFIYQLDDGVLERAKSMRQTRNLLHLSRRQNPKECRVTKWTSSADWQNLSALGYVDEYLNFPEGCFYISKHIGIRRDYILWCQIVVPAKAKVARPIQTHIGYK